jgi:phage gp36-like protein
MSYATKQHMIERYGERELVQLTDALNMPPAAIDDTVLQAKLDDADAEINSWLAARVTTPVSPVPRILVNKACAIARKYLYSDRATQQVTDDYEDAMTWLRAVSKGQVAIGDNTAETVAPSAGSPQISGPDRVFTPDTLVDF